MFVGEKDIQRFLIKVDKTDSCWIWTANKDKNGYGRFKFERYPHPAHRFSYKLFKGEIPKGMLICHSCDNPSCVNPEHLWLGSCSDNTRDMVSKNRHGKHMKSRTCCKNGHEYAVVGTFIYNGKRPKRECRECKRNAEKRRRNTPEKLSAYREYQREYQKCTRNKKKNVI
jgi:hypothetical protein